MNSESTRAIGTRGEEQVTRFLQDRDYHIIERNWTCRGGEIDIICAHEGTVVFVEVRARRDTRHGSPVETVNDRKRRRLILAARQYLTQRGLWDQPCRFDVVGVVGEELEHVVDAFGVGDLAGY